MLLLLLPVLAQAIAPADSAAVRRAAEAQQAGFERQRRLRLPLTLSASRCDVRVGRYCYWYDEHEPPPPPEPAAIGLLREELLAHLARAAGLLPGDRWIAAQRVRYLVEHGRADSAVAAARACAADPWWCAALEGFAHHAAHRHADAEAAFGRAAARMPDAVRCRWNDLEPLLENADARDYGRLDCAGRDSANAVLLARSRPLLALAVNDLATELWARRVFVDMQREAVTHHGSRMGPDLAEIVLRYGWATAWSRRMEYSVGGEGFSVVGHEPRPSFAFLVDAGGSGAWPPRPAMARARYAPRHASTVVALESVQWARFARGEATLLVAAFRVPADTLFRGPLRATLAAASHRGIVRVSTDQAGTRGVLRVQTPGPWERASLEVEAPDTRAWAVDRLVPEDGAWDGAISDLLLYEPGERDPEDVEEASRHALADAHVDGTTPVGLYWETYAARGRTTVMPVRVEVIPARPGFIGRVGRTLGLARRNPPLSLAWDRVLAPGVDPVAHTVELDLSRLQPGRYDIVVEMRGEGGARWVSSRTVTVARGPA
jgi:hypothetical protein